MSVPVPVRRSLIASTLLLAALPLQAGLLDNIGKAKPSRPVELAAGADPASQAASLVEVEKGERLAGHAKFALAGFTVEYQVMARDFDTQFGSAVGSKAKMVMEGVTPADMQALTDRIYSDFVARMQAQGITLVTPDQLSGKAWERVAKAGKDQTYEMTSENDKLLLVAPTGQKVIPKHPDEQTERLAWGFSGLKALSSGTLPQAEIALAEELGMPVMKAYFVVRFGTADAKALGGGSRTQVRVDGLILGDGQTTLSIRSKDDNPLPGMGRRNAPQDGDSFVRLKTSIMSSQSILAGDVRKSGGTGKALGNAMTMLTGAGSFSGEWVAPLDPAAYGNFAAGTLGAVSEMFAVQLKKAAGPAAR